MSLFDRLLGRRVLDEPMDPEIAEQKVKSDATLKASRDTLNRVHDLLDEHQKADEALAGYRRVRLPR